MRPALVAFAALLVAASPALARARDTAVITGDARDGGYLHCLPSAGATAAGLRVTWFRDGQAVPGASVPTFPLVDPDVGRSIACSIGTGAASAPVTVAAVPPMSDDPPTATFPTTGDGSITCSPGFVTGRPEPVASYAWFAGGVDTGATGDRYTPPPGVPIASVTCQVTLANAAGAVSQMSGVPRLVALVSSPPAAARRYLRLTPWRVLDRRGRLRAAVQCYAPGRAACDVGLTVRRAGAGSRLGEASVSIVPGEQRTVELPLSPAALASVAGRFAVRSEVSAAFATGDPGRVTQRVTIDGAYDGALGWARRFPGSGTHLQAGSAVTLARSLVVIAYRAAGTYGSWQPICTGTRVRIAARADAVVLTAAHCFEDLLPAATSQPVDLVGRGDRDFVILDGGARVADRATAPIAIVDGISVDRQAGVDLALVHARPEYLDTPVAGRRFADVPALPYAPPARPPGPGSPVLVNAAPGSLSRRQTRLLGRSAGRVVVPGIGRVDEVVVAPATADDDPCFFGGSGSLGIGPQGALLGPLTGRGSFGYPDGSGGEGSPAASGQLLFTQPIARALGLDRRVFSLDTICAYSTPDPAQVTGAASAFGSYPIA